MNRASLSKLVPKDHWPLPLNPIEKYAKLSPKRSKIFRRLVKKHGWATTIAVANCHCHCLHRVDRPPAWKKKEEEEESSLSLPFLNGHHAWSPTNPPSGLASNDGNDEGILSASPP